jgi:hypothetical protein
MSQIGRNVTDAVDGILNGKRYLIHDRDPLFTREFQNILASAGVTSVKLPPRSPNLKNYASYCTSLVPFDTFSCAVRRRSESLMPWALHGGLSPGCSYRHSFLSE